MNFSEPPSGTCFLGAVCVVVTYTTCFRHLLVILRRADCQYRLIFFVFLALVTFLAETRSSADSFNISLVITWCDFAVNLAFFPIWLHVQGHINTAEVQKWPNSLNLWSGWFLRNQPVFSRNQPRFGKFSQNLTFFNFWFRYSCSNFQNFSIFQSERICWQLFTFCSYLEIRPDFLEIKPNGFIIFLEISPIMEYFVTFLT